MLDEAMAILDAWCQKHIDSFAEIRSFWLTLEERRLTFVLYYRKPIGLTFCQRQATATFAYTTKHVNQFINPNGYLTQEFVFHAYKVARTASKDLGEDYG